MSKRSKVRPINTEIEMMEIGDLYRNTKSSPNVKRLPNGTYMVQKDLQKGVQKGVQKGHVRSNGPRTSSEEARFQKRKTASQLANMANKTRRGGRKHRKTVKKSRSTR